MHNLDDDNPSRLGHEGVAQVDNAVANQSQQDNEVVASTSHHKGGQEGGYYVSQGVDAEGGSQKR